MGQNDYNGNYHSEYRPLPFRVATSASQRATRKGNGYPLSKNDHFIKGVAFAKNLAFLAQPNVAKNHITKQETVQFYDWPDKHWIVDQIFISVVN